MSYLINTMLSISKKIKLEGRAMVEEQNQLPKSVLKNEYQVKN